MYLVIIQFFIPCFSKYFQNTKKKIQNIFLTRLCHFIIFNVFFENPKYILICSVIKIFISKSSINFFLYQVDVVLFKKIKKKGEGSKYLEEK